MMSLAPVISISSNDTWRSMNQITELLYVGNRQAGGDVSKLLRHDIKCVISFSKIMHPKSAESKMRSSGIKLKYLPIYDDPSCDILPVCRKARSMACRYTSIGKRVLFHCDAGISRSVSALIFFLMRDGLDYESAYKLIGDKRFMACPNSGFETALMKESERLAPIHKAKLNREIALGKMFAMNQTHSF